MAKMKAAPNPKEAAMPKKTSADSTPASTKTKAAAKHSSGAMATASGTARPPAKTRRIDEDVVPPPPVGIGEWLDEDLMGT